VTHTYALLKVSFSTYDEIAAYLRAAGYDHAFHDGAIDMHGIALIKEEREQAAQTYEVPAGECIRCGGSNTSPCTVSDDIQRAFK